MRYLSVCSGIEAATVAWEPLGWAPVAFSQFDPDHNYNRGLDFSSVVLRHHYPATPNWGDMTKFKDWADATFNVLVGGTPCQSFSVAGLRQGLADPRGTLALTYLGLVDRYRPEWCIWENVPGVLSSSKGRNFGAFLGGLAKLRYGFAYRVLDAQYVRVDGFGRAVPQRRRRVFVVGHSGGWRRPAAVLFEPESLSWDSPPRRETGQGPAPTISARPTGGGGLGTDFDLDGGLDESAVSQSLSAARGRACANATDLETYIPWKVAFGGNDTSGPIEVATARNGHAVPHGRLDFESETFVAHSLRPAGYDASEDGTGRASLVPVAFDLRGRDGGAQMEGPHNTANLRASSGGSSRSYISERWAVRRLTPRECERLQGFPDGYTDVPWRNRNWTPDGPRYKALGNSMAVNVMRWLGKRIQMVADLAS